MADEKGMESIDPKEIMTDMTLQEEKQLQRFIEKDMPGLSSVSDEKVAECFSMYMKGKSYTELSTSLRLKKPIILFLSKKNDWYEKKNDYISAIQENIQGKLINTKIESANFLTDVINAYHKIMEHKIRDALARGDKPSEFMDSKEMNVYFKAIDSLEKLLPKKGSDARQAAFNINVSGDAKVKTDKDGKSLSIECGASTEQTTKDVLAGLAKIFKESQKN